MQTYNYLRLLHGQKVLGCTIITGILLSAMAEHSVSAADPSFNKLPDVIKKSLSGNNSRAQPCPAPFLPQTKWGWKYSTGTGMPVKSTADVGSYFYSLANRPWGTQGINKTFVHTINTRGIKPEPCCEIKPRTTPLMYLYGSVTPGYPDPITGNQPGPGGGYDVLTFIENGNVFPSPPYLRLGLYANPTPGNQYWYPQPGTYPGGNYAYPIPSSVSVTDDDLSFVAGDDTNIHAVYVVAQFCCLPNAKSRPAAGAATRANPNAARQFQQLMNQDKGRAVAPTPRRAAPVAPATRIVQ